MRTDGASPQSLRSFLADLEMAGELRRVPETVDPRFELSALLAEGGRGPALLFESVRDHELPVVGNVLTGRGRVARALGIGVGELEDAIVDAIDRPAPVAPVTEAPCQEVALSDPDLAGLPIPTFFEHETGPYVTAGAIVARGPESGRGNLSIARLKPLGGNRALIGIAPNHHLAVMARAAGARGERLPIAVTIGNHPAVLVAACLYLGYGEDELERAGALLGAPVEVARCGHADLAVPAHCEIVLEGVLDPDERVYEGPVSEFHGMYEDYGEGYVVSVARLTRRRDAVYQAIQPGHHPEHLVLGGVAIAAGLARELRRLVPAVRAVALPEGGSGRLSAVVALDPQARPGSARRVMFSIWATVSLIRSVTVVDADVDPWDHEQVEWARTCFARPDRDLLVVPGGPADRSEPLELRGEVAKLGVDATRKSSDRADTRVARPPAQAMDAARKLLEGTG